MDLGFVSKLTLIGVKGIGFAARIYGLIEIVWLCLCAVFTLNFYKRQAAKSVLEIFFYSLSVIFLTSFFTGAVLTMQTYSGFGFFASSVTVAKVVAVAIATELGPVLTGIIIAGRVGASITAEVATMKVSDQINALITLSINPFRYIFFPRVFAGILVMPLLLIISDAIGFLGSFVVITQKYHLSGAVFVSNLLDALTIYKFSVGIFKSIVFGFIIMFCACYIGLGAEDGATGVGKATTNSVVISSILILVTNYFITLLTLTV